MGGAKNGKMKKKLCFKIIAIFLSLSLFLEAAVYGLDRDTLRVPLNTPAARFEETCKRGADSIVINNKDSRRFFKTATGVLFASIFYKSVSLMADTMQEPSKTGHFSWGTFFITGGIVITIAIIVIKIIKYIKNKEQRNTFKLHADILDLIPDGEIGDTSSQIKRDSKEYDALIQSRVKHFEKYYNYLDTITMLTLFLDHKNRDTRSTSLDILASFIKKKGATWVEVGLVLERLDDKDLEIKKRAIKILSSLGTDLRKVEFGVKNEVVRELRKQVLDPFVDPNVKQNAIDALKKIEPASDWDALLERISLSLFVFYGLKESNMDDGIVMEMIIATILILSIMPFSPILGKYLREKVFVLHIQSKISKINKVTNKACEWVTEKYESVRNEINRLDFLKGYRHKVSPCI